MKELPKETQLLHLADSCEVNKEASTQVD